MSHEPKSLEERKVEALESIAQSLKVLSGEALDVDAPAPSVPLSLEGIYESLRVIRNKMPCGG